MPKPSEEFLLSIHWSRALELLKVPTTVTSLPYRTTCLLCEDSRFVIYQDQLLGGQRVWCGGCQFQGTISQLVAAVWKLPHDIAVLRMAGLGFPIPHPFVSCEFLETHLDPTYKALQASWDFVQSRRSNYQRAVLARLGLRLTRTTRLNAHPREVIAITPTLAELDKKEVTSRNQSQLTQPIATIPLYSLPGQITGLLSLTTQEGKVSQKYRPTLPEAKRQPGLAYVLRTVDTASPAQVLVTTDPLVYLQLQFTLSQTQNPIQAVYCPPMLHNRPNWQPFHNKSLYFWMPTLDYRTLGQAIRADSSLFVGGPLEKHRPAMIKYIQDNNGKRFAANLQSNQCLHWSKYLHKLLQADEESFNLTIQKLHLNGFEFDRLRGGCSRYVSEQIAKALEVRSKFQTIRVNRQTIEQRRTGWYLLTSAGEEQIANCYFSVERVLYRHTIGQVLYQGNVVYQEQEYPFVAQGEEFEKAPLTWLRHFLIRQGVGMLRFNPTWERKIFNIATQFSHTELVEGIQRVGWDSQENQITLPRFNIRYNGEIQKRNELLVEEDLPGAALSSDCKHSVAELLPVADRCPGYWNVWIACIASILRPYLQDRQLGIHLSGRGGLQAYHHMVAALGLPQGDKPEEQFELARRHHWPAAYLAANTRSWRKFHTIYKQEETPLLLWSSVESGCLLGMHPDWVRVHATFGMARGFKKVPIQVTRELTIQFLSHALRTSFQPGKTLWKPLLQQVRDWRAAHQEEGSLKRSINLIIRGSTRFQRQFPELIHLLWKQGQIQIVDNRKAKNKAIYRILGEDRVFLPLPVLNQVLTSLQLDVLSLGQIKQHVQQCPGEFQEQTLLGQKGWSVCSHWLLGDPKTEPAERGLRVVS